MQANWGMASGGTKQTHYPTKRKQNHAPPLVTPHNHSREWHTPGTRANTNERDLALFTATLYAKGASTATEEHAPRCRRAARLRPSSRKLPTPSGPKTPFHHEPRNRRMKRGGGGRSFPLPSSSPSAPVPYYLLHARHDARHQINPRTWPCCC